MQEVPAFQVNRMSTAAYRGTVRYNGRRASGLKKVRRARIIAACCIGALPLWFVVNWAYHAIRKPTEVFAPVSPAFANTPASTWRKYGSLFQQHSTPVMTPDFLAALAQVEAQGNPLARTYWRWSWSWNPFDIYRPASSAVGMFQITDGTFREAKKYCIHRHAVVRDGPWYDVHSCWFNGLYSRVVPSHAVEMTAAYLHQGVVDLLSRYRVTRVSLEQRQNLAAVIHLCGAQRGEAFVKQGFRFAPDETCGSHNVRRYLAQVTVLKRQFTRLQTS